MFSRTGLGLIAAATVAAATVAAATVAAATALAWGIMILIVIRSSRR